MAHSVRRVTLLVAVAVAGSLLATEACKWKDVTFIKVDIRNDPGGGCYAYPDPEHAKVKKGALIVWQIANKCHGSQKVTLRFNPTNDPLETGCPHERTVSSGETSWIACLATGNVGSHQYSTPTGTASAPHPTGMPDIEILP
jgi:hypothetical protein